MVTPGSHRRWGGGGRTRKKKKKQPSLEWKQNRLKTTLHRKSMYSRCRRPSVQWDNLAGEFPCS